MLVLSTASPGIYGHAIGEMLGFDHIFATEVTAPERMPLISEVVGDNNKRSAKIRHMAKAGILPEGFDPANPYPIPDSDSYTDSEADLPLLAIAERGHLVHPNAALSEKGEANGWNTFLPPRPYGSRAGDVWAAVRQAFGLYGKAEKGPEG